MFEKRKLYSSIKGNKWGADLTDMQLITKYDKRFKFLLCVIDRFSKYTWVMVYMVNVYVPLKDKKSISITNVFQKILDKSNYKWVDKGSEFYNRSFKSWLQDNYTEM